MQKSNLFKLFDKWLVLLVGVLCVFLTSFALFRSEFFRPHDYTHAARIVEMQRSIQAGEFPVRWSENFGFGYGMPLFNFYAPFPYYLAQIPNGIFGVIIAIKFLYLFNAIVAFIGMYLLAREYWGKYGAILSAIIFSFSTYRALDLYVRGAVGEVFAMVAIPFALVGVVYLEKQKKGGFFWLSMSIAITLTSHNLLGLLLVPLVIIFAGTLAAISTKTREEKLRYLRSVGLSLLMGIGLCAFYVIPAYAEKGFTRVEQTITTGDFDFHNHFVALRQLLSGTWGYGGSIPGLEDGLSFALGTVALLLAASAIMMIWLKGSAFSKRLSIVLFFFFALFTWLTTSKSLWIWEHVSTLRFLQFPWRLLAFSHVFLALLGGGLVVGVHKRVVSVVILSAVLIFGVTQAKLFVPEKYLRDYSMYYRTDESFIRETLSLTLNDYLPPEVVGTNYPAPLENRLELISGEGTIKIIQEKPASLLSEVFCNTGCKLQINVFSFPGWRAYLNGVSLPLLPDTATATYNVEIPKGEHELLVRLERTPLRGLSELLSLVAWVIFIIGVVQLKRIKK
ncbi:hypothetical protein KBD71_00030 [Candidatus Woesebacteria bacterium]|nr:hypothetical protein [Candidatus Woesebacteria bacterium]